MRKKARQAAFGVFSVFLLLVVLLFAASVLEHKLQDHEETESELPTPAISSEVAGYEPLVKKYARQYGIPEYADVVLAIMMQETGGRGADPMQSSESYCGKRGCIKDPHKSIQQGTKYFSETLEASNGDVKLAIQSYNFGKGFIEYARRHGGYSEQTALDFSKQMYEQAPNKKAFRCLRAEARELGACYGDIYYVRSVLNYREAL